MVIGASRLPHIGSLLEQGMGEASSLHVAVSSVSAVMLDAATPCFLSQAHITSAPAMKQRRKPMMATPTFIPPPWSSKADDEVLSVLSSLSLDMVRFLLL